MSNLPIEPGGGPTTLLTETVENAIELKEVEGLSQGQIVRRRFFRHRGAIVGLVVIALIILLAYTSIGIGSLNGWWKWDPNDQPPLVNGGTPTLSLPSWLGGGGVALRPPPLRPGQLRAGTLPPPLKGTPTPPRLM